MIAVDQQKRVFTLHTQSITYQMKADEHNVLIHTYYGPRADGDLSYLVRYADRACAANPDEAGEDRTYSLDTLPQEYSTCGVGDFRLPSIEFELPSGSHSASLRYTGYELREGNYALDGLPAFRGTAEDAQTLVPRLKKLGMRFGIWIEPEMVNEDSALYREHPDWALKIPGRAPARGRNQLVLDISRREVREHIYGQIKAVLFSADVFYVKWDMNRSLTDVYSAALPQSRQGEVCHRYVLGVYEMLEWLRRDFPRILIEGCAGGGGRFDGGMLYYTPQIWCSDNTDAVDRLRIQYGTSFCYPVSTMGAHVSVAPNEQTGRITPLETRGTVAMAGTFGYEMDLSKSSEAEMEIIRRQISFFKEHYDLIQQGDYYRLSDPFQNGPFTAWEHASPDGREALVSLVTGSTHAAPSFLALRLKGLQPDAVYRVNGGEERYSGSALMEAGFPVPQLWGDYQSLQLYLKAE